MCRAPDTHESIVLTPVVAPMCLPIPSPSLSSPASKSALSATELELSQKALLRNPKCYGAWHHRLWVLDQGASDPQAELQVCGKMLEMDARNCQNGRDRANEVGS